MTILCFTQIAVVFGTQARLPDIAVLATSEVVNTAVIFDYGATKTAGTDVLVGSLRCDCQFTEFKRPYT
jgi:hypothetical protein